MFDLFLRPWDIRPAHCLLSLDCGCKSTSFSNTIREKAVPRQILKTQAAINQRLVDQSISEIK